MWVTVTDQILISHWPWPKFGQFPVNFPVWSGAVSSFETWPSNTKYTACKPQYSLWKYGGNMVNICRLYLLYFHWEYPRNIMKYPLYLPYIQCFYNIFSIFWDWRYSKYSLLKFTIFSIYFQWLYCGSPPVVELPEIPYPAMRVISQWNPASTITRNSTSIHGIYFPVKSSQ